MKIFVSHSSKDKWAARRVAKDIEELGHTVFLDEKDITTGESIDASIRTHLKSSEHFLILLSPASLNSQWVLLELGGALALEKTIVPILLYVGANEIPNAINLKLARDINDIDKYYREIGGEPEPPKAAARTTKPRSKPKMPAAFRVGSAVTIVKKDPNRIIRSEGTSVAWVPKMDEYAGRTTKVVGIDNDGDYSLDIDEKRFAWAEQWLRAAGK